VYNGSVPTILIIEPDGKLRIHLKDLLTKKGYEVAVSGEGAESLSLVAESQPDLLILDKKVTDVRGESICWQVKREYPSLPIILLLEEFEVERVAKLYRAGADDFMAKPVKAEKLLSRIRVQLTNRRTGKTEYRAGDLVLNLKTFQAKRGGRRIKLTPREFSLLKFLMRHKGRVLTRKMILERVWGYDAGVQSRVVDVYIGYLRDKIDKGSEKKLIRTVRGFGYMIKV
jgi:two-component system response regulator MprA